MDGRIPVLKGRICDPDSAEKCRWWGVCPVSWIVLVVVLVLVVENTEEIEDEGRGRLRRAVGRLPYVVLDWRGFFSRIRSIDLGKCPPGRVHLPDLAPFNVGGVLRTPIWSASPVHRRSETASHIAEEQMCAGRFRTVEGRPSWPASVNGSQMRPF
jgi:hypothetical protein